MSGHYVNVCSCGAVISQCRCPSPDKVRRVIPGGCHACRGEGGAVSNIPVYRLEREAGLEPTIRSEARVLLASVVRAAEAGRLSERTMARLRDLAAQHARGEFNDFDLHHLSTVLVTVGWNKNDDVFDPVETWVARRTPEDKQLNYEHDDSKIVGHITANYVMGEDGKAVADETVVEDLPAKFHIVTVGVLYKHWQTPELQQRVDTLIAEIAKGEWFVSMECLFKGFDYCLRDASGGSRVVARNEKTAFLSKHLRCYGGTGQYGDYRVGRLLRNIVFSGKGLVKNPANPESVILTSDSEPVVKSSAEVLTDFPGCCAERVYSLATGETAEERIQESHQVMTVTVEQVQAELAAAKNEIEKLKAGQTEAVINDLKAKVAAAEAARAKAEGDRASAEKCLADNSDAASKGAAELTTKVDALTKELDDAKKSLAEAQDELKGLYAEKTTLARVATAKEKLKLSDEAAAKFVEDTKSLAEDVFATQVETMVTAMTAWVTNNPQSGNTSFPGPAAKPAPKATDKPTAPKSTDKPAPMAGKAGAESDDAGELAAAETDLDAAQAANNDAALSTSVTDSGVTEVQKAIADCFGCADESAA